MRGPVLDSIFIDIPQQVRTPRHADQRVKTAHRCQECHRRYRPGMQHIRLDRAQHPLEIQP